MMKINNIDFKDLITKVLSDVTGINDISVEFASDEKFGDYSSNIALKNKDINLEDLVGKINKLELPFTASFVGRFINFSLKNDVLVDNLMAIDVQKLNNI